MIISDKQITMMIHFIEDYRNVLIRLNAANQLTSDGLNNLDISCALLQEIVNQQSTELKVISDE